MMSLRLLLFSILLAVSFSFDCTNLPISNSYANLTLTLTREESNPITCTFQVANIYQFTIPKINLEGRLTGSNSIVIRQNTTISGMQTVYTFGNSTTNHITLDLLPSYFEIQFNIVNNTLNDWLTINLTYANFDPPRVWLDFTQLLLSSMDSSEFIRNTYYYHSGNFLEFVPYQDPGGIYYAQKFLLYDDLKFLGTLYDFWNNMKGSLQISGIVNLNQWKGDYFSVVYGKTKLAGFNYTTRMTTSGLFKDQASTSLTRVIYEVRPKSMMPLNFRSLSVIGSGNVSIYAGCGAMPYPQHTIAVLNEHNYASFEDLSVRGRCLTYVLSNVQVSWWQQFYDRATTITARPGQQGVLMSYNYPYPETSRYTVTNTINPPANHKKLSVTYTNWWSDDVVITTSDTAQSLDTTSTTIKSKSYQSISCNVIDKGFLVQYKVNSARMAGLGWIFLILIVRRLIN